MVLYEAGNVIVGPPELYVVDVSSSPAGAPERVNAELPGGGGVEGGIWSPDSTRVLYIADQETDFVLELYLTELARRHPRLPAPGQDGRAAQPVPRRDE